MRHLYLTRRRLIVLSVFLLATALLSAALLGAWWRKPAEPLPIAPETPSTVREVIGLSHEKRPIESYTFGQGAVRLLFVGGMHGGYEWNSVLLAYELIDHLSERPTALPARLSVTVIPVLNPDGLFAVVGKEGRFSYEDAAGTSSDKGLGRFNALGVDLNRNFGCKWKAEGLWRGNAVKTGTGAFSEPEAAALKSFVEKYRPAAVVFWHSQANAVYGSECMSGVLPGTRTVMELYAQAAGYPAHESFDHYEVNGDAEGWLASLNIPAITVELSTHEAVEWEQNRAGIEALLAHFGTNTDLSR